jgi:hypothetical protein
VRRKDPAEKYWENIRHQQKTLEEFAAREIEWADDLLFWYRLKKLEIPDDEYRAVAFFINKEYLRKPGSLTLLYSIEQRLYEELPKPARETAFDWVAFRYKIYAKTLEKGGFS